MNDEEFYTKLRDGLLNLANLITEKINDLSTKNDDEYMTKAFEREFGNMIKDDTITYEKVTNWLRSKSGIHSVYTARYLEDNCVLSIHFVIKDKEYYVINWRDRLSFKCVGPLLSYKTKDQYFTTMSEFTEYFDKIIKEEK